MITHMTNNRCSQLVISLDECPWLRRTNVQLPGYIYVTYGGTNYATRDAKLPGGVKIRCFESCENNYVVNLFYNESSEEAQVQRAKDALAQWYSDLYILRSCEIDPHTGKPPAKVELWDDFI